MQNTRLTLTEEDWYWVLYGREAKERSKCFLKGLLALAIGMGSAFLFQWLLPSPANSILYWISALAGIGYFGYRFYYQETYIKDKKCKAEARQILRRQILLS